MNESRTQRVIWLSHELNAAKLQHRGWVCVCCVCVSRTHALNYWHTHATHTRSHTHTHTHKHTHTHTLSLSLFPSLSLSFSPSPSHNTHSRKEASTITFIRRVLRNRFCILRVQSRGPVIGSKHLCGYVLLDGHDICFRRSEILWFRILGFIWWIRDPLWGGEFGLELGSVV